MILLKVTAS